MDCYVDCLCLFCVLWICTYKYTQSRMKSYMIYEKRLIFYLYFRQLKPLSSILPSFRISIGRYNSDTGCVCRNKNIPAEASLGTLTLILNPTVSNLRWVRYIPLSGMFFVTVIKRSKTVLIEEKSSFPQSCYLKCRSTQSQAPSSIITNWQFLLTPEIW